ncbi:MAG: GHKL domain-containing protein [Syntrophomonas sp.]
MHYLPWFMEMIHNLADGCIIVLFGMIMIGVPPSFKRLLSVVLIFAAFKMYVAALTLPFGVGPALILIMTSATAMVAWYVGYFRAAFAIVMGITLQFLLDGALIPIITSLGQINVHTATPIQSVVLFLPQFILGLLFIYLCFRFDFHMLKYIIPSDSELYASKTKENLILGLYVCILIFIVFEMMYNLSDFGYFIDPSIISVPVKVLDWISNITVMAAIFMVSFLIKQLLDLNRRESEYMFQKSYAETLDELHTAIRAERHDLANHYQTIYGFLQLGYADEATRYVESLIGDTPLIRGFTGLGNVPLSALFYIKIGLAKEWDIDFKLDILTPVDSLTLPPYQLNRMVGNLINNAFEAAAKLPQERRWVHLRVKRSGPFYYFEVSNYGHISGETLRRITDRGFTTKKEGHGGLGLYIVTDLVNKYNGRLSISSENDTVIVTLSLPIEEPDLESPVLTVNNPQTGQPSALVESTGAKHCL